MTPELEQAVDELCAIQWFVNVGKPFAGTLALKVTPVDTWAEAAKTRGRLRSGNAFLEGAGMLTRELGKSFRPEYRKWNIVAESARDCLFTRIMPTVDPIIGRLVYPSEDAAMVQSAVEWDLVHVLMERAYASLVPPRFYGQILEVYRAGHFPCHWDERWPEGTLRVF